MLYWILTLVAVSLLSYLADVGVVPILRAPVPFLGGSTISVILMVVCMGMLLRIARLMRRGERETREERVEHLQNELGRLAESFKAGKINVRLDRKGKIIPERQDIEDVKREHIDASDAEKWRLSQASALLRAKREYEQQHTD